MLPTQQPESASDTTKLHTVYTQLRLGVTSGRLKTFQERMDALDRVEQLVQENAVQISQAITDDLGRPFADTYLAELSVVLEEVKFARKNLKKWMRSERKSIPLLLFPSKAYVQPQPYGLALIIGPWNYPFQLLLAPLIAALAAGNCVVLKPSELTPNCSKLIADLIPKYLSSDSVHVIEGDSLVTQTLLEMKWDVIFFTGSTRVGRIIASAASKQLTPVVLELGGKSPCILDASADLKVSARRILWGKLLNSGQTCVAPDYIFAHRSVVENLCRELEKTIAEFFPTGFTRNETYCGIVNQQHFQRLEKIAHAHKAQLRIGGKLSQSQRLIEPSFYLLDSAQLQDAPLMADEIFGPLTPIIAYENIEEVIGHINSGDNPLAIYIFSKDQTNISKVENQTRSGSFVVNDSVIQLATTQLPFGGVGASGMGSYHGESGFRAFSHYRSVLKRPFFLDVSLRYRPYTKFKLWILQKLIGYTTTKLN